MEADEEVLERPAVAHGSERAGEEHTPVAVPRDDPEHFHADVGRHLGPGASRLRVLVACHDAQAQRAMIVRDGIRREGIAMRLPVVVVEGAADQGPRCLRSFAGCETHAHLIERGTAVVGVEADRPKQPALGIDLGQQDQLDLEPGSGPHDALERDPVSGRTDHLAIRLRLGRQESQALDPRLDAAAHERALATVLEHEVIAGKVSRCSRRPCGSA
ncbi:MAG: hypothetical protein E6J87_06550 [Deltaproteobacteria bacterium]|nr:MAG: hypothetical protein E6J87_06550 [Deltaproteobacteria bacterium]